MLGIRSKPNMKNCPIYGIIASKSNQKLIPVSLTLRTIADKYGNNEAPAYKMPTTTRFSLMMEATDASSIMTKAFINTKDQYSARLDLPENTNDFFQQLVKCDAIVFI